MRSCLAFLVSLALTAQTQGPQETSPATPAMRELMQDITADRLRGDVSFLASDLLEGRDTPSAGLDIAAAYVSAQFRGAGLEAAGDDGYFQTAVLRAVQPKPDGIALAVLHDGQVLAIEPREVTAQNEIYDPFSLKEVQVVKAPFEDYGALTREQVEGKVVLTRLRTLREVPAEEQADYFAAYTRFREAMRRLGPALLINVNPKASRAPRSAPQYAGEDPPDNALRSLTVNSQTLAGLFDALPAGPAPWVISARAEAAESTKLTARNVVGFWRGSDAQLKDSYVLLSAHYDHVGAQSGGEDRIFNGANDDASGTAALIALARAFGKLRPHPRRSVVFVAYFGEEKGMLGSRYYASHPLFPLDRTVANLNLEHLGRVDDNEGSQLGKATLTGFEFSTISGVLQQAGAITGYEIYARPGNAAYFDRSDNAPLAAAGVPAHTLAVTFEFPDYHGVGDEWPKLDYINMERVVQTVAVGALMIADAPNPPQWNEAEPKTAAYREARDRVSRESPASQPR